MNVIWTQLGSALFWILYGSFFEWYWHCCWMHRPRFPREAFHRHTLVHHTRYKGDESFYYLQETGHPDHVLLKPYALPAIVAAHLPFLYLIDRYVVHHTLLGALATIFLYFVTYEYVHWNIHVPRGHFIERFRWFQFLRTHHKLHHRYYQWNYCVLFPLADLCLGTLLTQGMLQRRKAKREGQKGTGSSGNPAQPKKRRKRYAALAQESMMTALPRRSRRTRLLLEHRWLLRLAQFREEKGNLLRERLLDRKGGNSSQQPFPHPERFYSFTDLKELLTLHRSKEEDN